MPISSVIPNLPVGTSIDVRVRAFNQAGFGPYSTTATMNTVATPTPTPVPTPTPAPTCINEVLLGSTATITMNNGDLLGIDGSGAIFVSHLGAVTDIAGGGGSAAVAYDATGITGQKTANTIYGLDGSPGGSGVWFFYTGNPLTAGDTWATSNPQPVICTTPTPTPTPTPVPTPTPTPFPTGSIGRDFIIIPEWRATSSGTGPTITGNFINIDFAAPTGNTLNPWLFGSSMASDGPNDFGSAGTNWGNAGVQNSAKNIAGFGLPGMFARSNSNETTLNSDGSPALDKVDRISQFLPNIISMPTSATDMAHGQFSFSLGVQSPDGIGGVSPATYAASALTIHKRFISNGAKIWHYEIGNEPNGRTDPTAYCNVVNATAQALHGFDPTIRIIAGTTAAIGGTGNPAIDAIPFTTTVAQQSGSNLDIMSYHNYSTDPNGFNGYAGQIRQAMAGTACAGKPTMAGEYNQDGSGNGNSDQRTMHGCLVNIGQMYGTWKADPLTIIGARWDWLGDGDYGMIGDPDNGNPPGLGDLNVIPWGYATKNLRGHVGGPEVAVNLLPGALQCIATKNGTNFGLWLINQGGSAVSGQIALSHWPVNGTGNGSVNVYTVSSTFPQSNTQSFTVSGGLTQTITIPAGSVVVISNT